MLGHNNNLLNKLLEYKNENHGVTLRQIKNGNKTVYIFYIMQITDRKLVSSDIIKPILEHETPEDLEVEIIADSIIYSDSIVIDNDENKVVDYILNGNTVILLDKSKKYIAANTKKVEKRGIEQPEVQGSLRAPRDAFNENLDDNLSLLRYRIKDPELMIDKMVLGQRTHTEIAIVYAGDVVSPKLISGIKSRLSTISVDGIIESGYVQKFLTKSSFNIFPVIGIAERSDSASSRILDGKVCILVDGSNIALILPQVITDFFDSGDDHYGNIYISILTKLLRVIALAISLTLSALYVALVAYQPDILPYQYIIVLAMSRITVPFNALPEAVVMEVISELLREASIRLPKQIGPAIGIVGTIVIGQAAVVAGLVSPLMVIIISLSTMSSFAAPDYTITGPIRILKFFLIFITGIFGLYGFVLGFTVIVINVISLDSFGTPYTAPVSPIIMKGLQDYFLSDVRLNKRRPSYLQLKNKTRGK